MRKFLLLFGLVVTFGVAGVAAFLEAQGPGTGPGSVSILRQRTSDPTFCPAGGIFVNTSTNEIRVCLGGVWVSLPAQVLKTRQVVFILGAENGAVLVDGDDQPTIYVNRLGQGITVTEVWCESNAGTPSINLQRDDGTPANILSSNLSCSTAGATGTIDGAEDNVANGDRVDFVMVTAGGVAVRITVGVKYTVD